VSKDNTEVRVAVDGVIASGPLTATAPTDAVAPLATGASGFTDLGYVSEDGVTETNSQTVEQIRAWQKAAVVRSTVTEGEVTFAYTLIQTNADTLAEYYGATVAADGSIVVDPTRERPHRKYVVDVIDGDELIRTYVPDGQVTEVGDQVFQNGAPIGYECTVTAFYNEQIGGVAKKWYASLDAS